MGCAQIVFILESILKIKSKEYTHILQLACMYMYQVRICSSLSIPNYVLLVNKIVYIHTYTATCMHSQITVASLFNKLQLQCYYDATTKIVASFSVYSKIYLIVLFNSNMILVYSYMHITFRVVHTSIPIVAWHACVCVCMCVCDMHIIIIYTCVAIYVCNSCNILSTSGVDYLICTPSALEPAALGLLV